MDNNTGWTSGWAWGVELGARQDALKMVEEGLAIVLQDAPVDYQDRCCIAADKIGDVIAGLPADKIIKLMASGQQTVEMAAETIKMMANGGKQIASRI